MKINLTACESGDCKTEKDAKKSCKVSARYLLFPSIFLKQCSGAQQKNGLLSLIFLLIPKIAKTVRDYICRGDTINIS